MRVVILAAGYGTRLYPLTLNTPKPLLKINGKPIINFLMEKIKGLEQSFPIKEVKVISNNKFYRQFRLWQKEYNLLEVTLVNDGSNSAEERRGAIKAIKLATGDTIDDWLVLGGDNMFDDDLVGFIEYSLEHKPYPCIGIYDVKDKKLASRLGVVKLDKKGRIIELKEKPVKPATTLAATCIYFFPRESLKFLDIFLEEHTYTDASGKYVEWLSKETKVYAYLLKGEWLDIGHKDSLREAEFKFKKEESKLSL